MTHNDVILLQEKLARHHKQITPSLPEAEHDIYFTVEQYLKYYTISHDEILAGIVDGELDCGIDAIYFFANGICISTDTPLSALGRGVSLDIFILQVKNSRSFGEDAIDKLIVNIPRLLSFDRDEGRLSNYCNSRLIETTRRLLYAYRDLDMPELHVYVCFASLKATGVHPQTQLKAEQLERTIFTMFGGAEVEIRFLGAADICALTREYPSMTRELMLKENPISTDMAGGYVGVVGLDDYQRFISTPSGDLDVSLFDANVRDYEGDTDVNEGIRRSLSTIDDQIDFLWLNNGVTIVATRVQPAGKLLKLESPQIVNGLQTSTEIYKRERPSGQDNRSVLVKVVEARDAGVRDLIIEATNSQTTFGPSALRATDVVQQEIEEYLLGRDLFYERRRRQYYNQGVNVERIVTIDQMGEAVLSVVVQAPHVARENITRIYQDDIYQLVFHPDFPVAMFSASINIFRQCETWLRGLRQRSSVDDFVFHLACLAGIGLSRKIHPDSADIAKLENAQLPSPLAQAMFEIIQTQYNYFSQRTGIVLLDQLAKNPDVTKSLLNAAREYLRTSSRK